MAWQSLSLLCQLYSGFNIQVHIIFSFISPLQPLLDQTADGPAVEQWTKQLSVHSESAYITYYWTLTIASLFTIVIYSSINKHN